MRIAGVKEFRDRAAALLCEEEGLQEFEAFRAAGCRAGRGGRDDGQDGRRGSGLPAPASEEASAAGGGPPPGARALPDCGPCSSSYEGQRRRAGGAALSSACPSLFLVSAILLPSSGQ